MNKPADKSPELQLKGALDLSPSPERCPVEIQKRYGHFINGKMVKGDEKSDFKTINPATAKPIAKIAAASEAEVDDAVQAARKAYDGVWSKMSGAERGKYIYRIARRMQERAREFAVIETIDNGKPIRETRDVDTALAAQHFFYYAGWADKLDYAVPGRKVRSIGVAGQVIPWNFPLLMAAWEGLRGRGGSRCWCSRPKAAQEELLGRS